MNEPFTLTEIDPKKDDLEAIAGLLIKGFPHRSINYFVNILDKLNGETSKGFVMIVDGELKGVISSYDAFVSHEEPQWACCLSYWYIEPEARKHSLLFLAKLNKIFSKRMIFQTPVPSVTKIIKALGYKERTKGSYIMPCFSGLLSLFSKNKVTKIEGNSANDVPKKYFNRDDLLWLNIEDKKSPPTAVCLKKAKRFGLTFYIVVYVPKKGLARNEAYLLAKRLFFINPFALIIFPRYTEDRVLGAIKSEKLHIFANFKPNSQTFSLLGSETTEALS